MCYRKDPYNSHRKDTDESDQNNEPGSDGGYQSNDDAKGEIYPELNLRTDCWQYDDDMKISCIKHVGTTFAANFRKIHVSRIRDLLNLAMDSTASNLTKKLNTVFKNPRAGECLPMDDDPPGRSIPGPRGGLPRPLKLRDVREREFGAGVGAHDRDQWLYKVAGVNARGFNSVVTYLKWTARKRMRKDRSTNKWNRLNRKVSSIDLKPVRGIKAFPCKPPSGREHKEEYFQPYSPPPDEYKEDYFPPYSPEQKDDSGREQKDESGREQKDESGRDRGRGRVRGRGGRGRGRGGRGRGRAGRGVALQRPKRRRSPRLIAQKKRAQARRMPSVRIAQQKVARELKAAKAAKAKKTKARKAAAAKVAKANRLKKAREKSRKKYAKRKKQ